MTISQITDYLCIAARNDIKEIEMLRQLEIRLIIDMVIHRRPPGEVAELNVEVISLPAVDFILLPIPIKLLNRGVEKALPILQDDGRVLVYCQVGRHRSVAMAACILISQGYSANEAMTLIADRRSKADPYAWHIQRQICKFEQYWNHQSVPLKNR